jgi:hypothetical protein
LPNDQQGGYRPPTPKPKPKRRTPAPTRPTTPTRPSGGGSTPARRPTGGGGGGSVINQVVAFFRAKGLSDGAIAGILGNMRVESGFDTGAYNGGEGAVGLVQWEGGRDDAMRSWAAAHGMGAGSVEGQLGYIWHELTTSYSGVLNQLRHTNDAGQAATIWDSQYEISAGTTRNQRINSAQAFMASGLRSDGGSAGNVGNVSGGGSGGGGNGGGGAGGGGNNEDDFLGATSLGDFLKSVPQLNAILQRAEAGGWTTDRFLNAVQDSQWFKNHNETTRAALALQANDPATWNRNLRNTENSLTTLSKSLGFTVDQATLKTIATNAILTGNQANQDWLTGALGRRQDFSDVTNGASLNGAMATDYQQLEQMSKAYGITVSAGTLAQYAQQIAMGRGNLDHYQEHFKQLAAGKYPGLVSQIQAGQTVQQIADPFVQQYAQLLELDPNAVDWMKTPIIQQALQGTPTGQGSAKAAMSLNDFEKQVRTDPRWGHTQNAKDTFSTALVKIGADFGFGF